MIKFKFLEFVSCLTFTLMAHHDLVKVTKDAGYPNCFILITRKSTEYGHTYPFYKSTYGKGELLWLPRLEIDHGVFSRSASSF